jgi:hypothetical protein
MADKDLVIKSSVVVKGGDITGDAGQPADIINMQKGGFQFVIDGSGSEITDGVAGEIIVPFNCQITSVQLLADQTGSIVVDIFSDGYNDYPPDVSDSITASAKPTISSGNKYIDSTLTGWTVLLNSGDVIRFSVDSCTTITRCVVILNVRKL